MPEIAEAARIVHFLKTHLVGKRIKAAVAIDDSSVFGKAGTTGDEVAKGLKGKKVVSAGSQGKYFWLVLDRPPHLVMHFGMTGWMHIKGMRTGYTNYYSKLKPDEVDLWPPKYWKFHFETDSSPKVEVAFTDPRRFGRVRLVDCPGDSIRKHSPLVENGPDPVVDAETTFTEDYFVSTLHKRHVPIKALLLDQAFISGIGNWVGDEVLFHARLHPEQYCDEFSNAQMKKLYTSIRHVCSTAVGLLGDSDQFPDDWLFRYRWGKGSKNAVAQLPSGEKLSFLTVGGRTSCYAPGLQKKSGSVVPGIKEEHVIVKEEKAATTKPAKAAGSTSTGKGRTGSKKEKQPLPPTGAVAGTKKRKHNGATDDIGAAEEPAVSGVHTKKNSKQGTPKKLKAGPAGSAASAALAASAASATTALKLVADEMPTARAGRRRSTRLSTE